MQFDAFKREKKREGYRGWRGVGITKLVEAETSVS